MSIKSFPIDVLTDLEVVPAQETGEVQYFFSTRRSYMLVKKLELLVGKRVLISVIDKDSYKNKLAQYSKAIEQFEPEYEHIDDFNLDDALGEQLNDVERNIASDITVKLLNSILNRAFENRASDLHFELHRNHGEIRLRVDGVLTPFVKNMATDQYSRLIARLKVLCNLDIAEKRVAQDGRFKYKTFGGEVDCRASFIPSQIGENVVLRLLGGQMAQSGGQEQMCLELDKDNEDYVKIIDAINRPYGIVIFSGPTGSGKTTTLYSCLAQISVDSRKIITIEDPVEYELSGAMQIAVNNVKGMNFTTGLRAILRHDPDVIMVGEIRDEETAKIAIQSALTGHLVLTSIHANSAVDVFARFLNMGVDRVDLISALNCIVNQRLIRIFSDDKVCSDHVADNLSEVEVFNGRKMISETILIDNDLRKKWLSTESLETLFKDFSNQVDSTLRQKALAELNRGATTLEEVNRVTFN
jgi:type II secretory ATPase GspE/PulE/Tfp pilus assembly ATPase PilB-like protein